MKIQQDRENESVTGGPVEVVGTCIRGPVGEYDRQTREAEKAERVRLTRETEGADKTCKCQLTRAAEQEQ